MPNVLFFGYKCRFQIAVAKFKVSFENDELKATAFGIMQQDLLIFSKFEEFLTQSIWCLLYSYICYDMIIVALSYIALVHFDLAMRNIWFAKVIVCRKHLVLSLRSKLTAFRFGVSTESIATVASKLHPIALLVAWAQQPLVWVLPNAYFSACLF